MQGACRLDRRSIAFETARELDELGKLTPARSVEPGGELVTSAPTDKILERKRQVVGHLNLRITLEDLLAIGVLLRIRVVWRPQEEPARLTGQAGAGRRL